MHKDTTNNSSPLAAGVAGLILGIAGTSAIILSDEETRKKMAKKAHVMKENVKKWSKKTMNDVTEDKNEQKKLDEKKDL